MALQKQNSFGSVGSVASRASAFVGAPDDGADAGDVDATKPEKLKDNSGQGGLSKALFGALYTLAKEKFSESAQVALINIVVDFLLILVIFLHLEYPWAVDPKSSIYKVFFWLEIQRPLAARGFDFYIVIFYLVCALLYLCIGICVWVAWCFKEDNFPFLWPIKFVRVVASIFFGTFYIASLNIFLTTAECIPYGSHWVHHIWHDDCFTMPLLVHAAVALFSCAMFAAVNLLLIIADHELKPLSTSLLAAPHSMTELKAVVLKTIITTVDILGTPWLKVQAVIFCLCTALNLYWHLAQLPYYTAWVNCLRCALYGVHAWVALCLVILMFSVQAKRVGVDKEPTKTGEVFWTYYTTGYDQALVITNLMWYGMLPAFCLCGLGAFLRLTYFFRVGLRFRVLKPDQKSRLLYKFSSDTDVEVISRVLRVWDEDKVPDPLALDLGEVILKSGLQQFPEAPFVRIAYANFLIECKQQMQSGWTQLEMARKMHPNISFRFSIFTWEQEQKQKAASSSSGSANADLVSYVEFQKNYKNLMQYHKAALVATRNFWAMLMHERISMVQLGNAFRRINMMEAMADKTYKLVLERYPNSVKLLRAYADFLETVKNDPWTASQYYATADKQEEEQENAAQDDTNAEASRGGNSGLLDAKGNAVITINALGIIQTANKAACSMFGYVRGELEKKNIKILMPQPFSGRHDQFMRNYMTTGKAKILDTMREVLGQHALKHVFPVRIYVSKASGTGADSMFMGILKAVETDKSIIRAWLLPSGTILCVDQNFIDYAGYATKDLLGKPLSTLASDPALVSDMLRRAAMMTEAELATGVISADTKIHHKHADDVPVHMKFEMGGTEEQRLLVVTMKRMGPTEPMGVFDHHGTLMYANTVFAHMMGYDVDKMAGMKISKLMAEPYGYLHHRWIREQDDHTTKPTPASCRSNQVFDLVCANGTTIQARLAISVREFMDHHQFVVKAHKVPSTEKDDGRRILMHVDSEGKIVHVSQTPHTLFAFPAGALMGRNLADSVDIFAKWREAGNDVADALEAMMIHTNKSVGASWRVGVIPNYLEETLSRVTSRQLSITKGGDAAAAAGAALSRQGSARALVKAMSNASRGKPAIMQIKALNTNMLDIVMAAPGAPVAAVTLWRPEMVTGVIELDASLKILKADSHAAMALGRSLPTLYGHHLSHFLKATAVPVTFDELMGVKAKSGNKSGGGSSGGGLKGRKPGALHGTGPKKQYEGLHKDGYPLALSVQAALKHGRDRERLVLMVKPNSNVKGDVAVIEKLMVSGDAHESEGMDLSDQGSSVLGAGGPGKRPPGVPALALRGLQTIPELPGSVEGWDKSRATSAAGARSHAATPPASTRQTADDDAMLTARDVGIQGLDSARSSGGGKGTTTARAVEINIMDSARQFAPRSGASPGASPTPPGSASGRRLSHDLPSSRLHSPSPMQEARRRSIAEAAVMDAGNGNDSSNGISDDSAKVSTPPGGKGAARDEAHRLKDSIRERGSMGHHSLKWEDVDHQDPDEVPIPEGAEFEIDHHQVVKDDMTVSSGSGSGSDDADLPDRMVLERKQTMEGLDPEEQTRMRKSIKIVKAWLLSGYSHSGWHGHGAGGGADDSLGERRDGGGVANEADRQASLRRRFHQEGKDKGEEEQAAPKTGGWMTEVEPVKVGRDHGKGGEGAKGEEEEGKEEEGGEGAEEHVVHEVTESDFKRGKRLKRLMKLLSGKAATKALRRLKLHIWFIMGGLMLLHIAFFVVIFIWTSRQKVYVKYVSAAGEAMLYTHQAATYANAIDAAFRGYGFNVKDNMPFFYEKLTESLNELAVVHEGLYLGFRPSKPPQDDRLTFLWEGQLDIFEYQDTIPPTMSRGNMTLWDLGGSFLTAGREVGYLAQKGAASNTTSLTLNRFYLFMRENGPGALQNGYLHVLNVITVKAQEMAKQTRMLLIALLVVEVVALAIGGVGYMIALLRAVAQSRAALFTVFLFVPSGLLRSLASKSVVVADLDDDNAQRKKRAASAAGNAAAVAAAGGTSIGGTADQLMLPGGMSGGGDGFPSGPPRASADLGNPARKRVSMDVRAIKGGGGDSVGGGRPSIGGGQSTDGGGGRFGGKGVGFSIDGEEDTPRRVARHRVSIQLDTVQSGAGGSMEGDPLSARTRPSPAIGASDVGLPSPYGRPSMDSAAAAQVISRLEDKSFSGTYKRQISGEIDLERNIFNSKKITETGRDVYKLLWPFVAWMAIVLMAYIIGIFAFEKFPDELNHIKMMQRSAAQASRVTYYASRLALGGPADSNAVKAALQQQLTSEASWLETVYRTALYGGPTLNDSFIDSSHDDGDGSLFAEAQHAYQVFMAVGCLRVSNDAGGTPWGAPCANTSSPLYQVSSHAIDPMLRRLVNEAELMALDAFTDINASSSRWFYIWSIGRVDLIDGLTALVKDFESDTEKAFSTITLLQIIMVVCVLLLVAVYLVFMFRPFLTASFEESKRVAELLAQLPSDMEVEAMVEATYSLVIKHQLDKRALHMTPSRANSMASMGRAVSRFFGSMADMVSMTGGASRRSQDLPSPKGKGASVPFIPYGSSASGLPLSSKLRAGSLSGSPRRGSMDQVLGSPTKSDVGKRLSLQLGFGGKVHPLGPSKLGPGGQAPAAGPQDETFKYNKVMNIMDTDMSAYQAPSMAMDAPIQSPLPWVDPPETEGLYTYNRVMSPSQSPEPGGYGRGGGSPAAAPMPAPTAPSAGDAGWQVTAKRGPSGRAHGALGPSPLGASGKAFAVPSLGPSAGPSPAGSSRALTIPATASSPRPGSGGGIGSRGSPRLVLSPSHQDRVAVAPVAQEEWNPITGSASPSPAPKTPPPPTLEVTEADRLASAARLSRTSDELAAAAAAPPFPAPEPEVSGSSAKKMLSHGSKARAGSPLLDAQLGQLMGSALEQVLAPEASGPLTTAAAGGKDDADDDVKAFMPQPESSHLEQPVPQRSGNLLMTEASGLPADDAEGSTAEVAATPRKLATPRAAPEAGGAEADGPVPVAEGAEKEVEAVQSLLGQLLSQETGLLHGGDEGGMAMEEVTGNE